tara:strand:- start:540 stop:827 length:288 start_codon:yes stop_codon:yes gene_type:complete
MWLKNSSGKRDAMLTFATIAFIIVSLNILLSTIQELIFAGGQSISFQLLDTGTMTAYLAATFGAYVSRRWTDRKFIDSKEYGIGAQNNQEDDLKE